MKLILYRPLIKLPADENESLSNLVSKIPKVAQCANGQISIQETQQGYVHIIESNTADSLLLNLEASRFAEFQLPFYTSRHWEWVRQFMNIFWKKRRFVWYFAEVNQPINAAIFGVPIYYIASIQDQNGMLLQNMKGMHVIKAAIGSPDDHARIMSVLSTYNSPVHCYISSQTGANHI